MDYTYVCNRLKLGAQRKNFDNELDWVLYKNKVVEDYLNDPNRRQRVRDKFHQLHDEREYRPFFRVGSYRKIYLAERQCNWMRAQGTLPERPLLSLEDFIIHLHWFKTTFTDTPEKIREDLASLDTYMKKDILDSVLYKDVYIGYMYRVTRRMTRYLLTGKVYSENRLTHRTYKELPFNEKYFTKRERDILKGDYIMRGIVRDRMRWYLDMRLREEPNA